MPAATAAWLSTPKVGIGGPLRSGGPRAHDLGGNGNPPQPLRPCDAADDGGDDCESKNGLGLGPWSSCGAHSGS
eukprot:14740757-Alexandrium_andersonii.AAC.1